MIEERKQRDILTLLNYQYEPFNMIYIIFIKIVYAPSNRNNFLSIRKIVQDIKFDLQC